MTKEWQSSASWSWISECPQPPGLKPSALPVSWIHSILTLTHHIEDAASLMYVKGLLYDFT